MFTFIYDIISTRRYCDPSCRSVGRLVGSFINIWPLARSRPSAWALATLTDRQSHAGSVCVCNCCSQYDDWPPSGGCILRAFFHVCPLFNDLLVVAPKGLWWPISILGLASPLNQFEFLIVKTQTVRESRLLCKCITRWEVVHYYYFIINRHHHHFVHNKNTHTQKTTLDSH